MIMGNFQIPFNVHLLKLIRVCTMFPSRCVMVNFPVVVTGILGDPTPKKCNPTHPSWFQVFLKNWGNDP